jgi:hypothetical protein
MLFKEITALYSEDYMTPINSLYRQNAELLIVKEGDIYIYIPLGFKKLNARKKK